MRKKISCKVIRTTSLDKGVDELHSKSSTSVKSHNINTATSTSNTNSRTRETTTNPQVKGFSKSVIYTDRLNIKSIPINSALTTSTINFYA